MRAMNGEIVPELAWQMGRPVRYGGELRVFEERARHMIAHRREALAPVVPEAEGGLPPLYPPRAAGRRARRRALELSLPDGGQHHRAGADGRQRVILKDASQTMLVGRPLPEAMDRAGLPKGCSSICCSTMRHRGDHCRRARRSSELHRLASRVDEPSSAPPPARSVGRAWSSAARTRPMCGPTPTSNTRWRTWSTALLQFRAELLRHRAHLCARERLHRFVEGFVALDAPVRAGRSARREDHARADGATRFAEVVREQTAEAVAKGAERTDRPEGVHARRDGTP